MNASVPPPSGSLPPSKLMLRSEILAVIEAIAAEEQPQRLAREKQVQRLVDLGHRPTVLGILLRELTRAKNGRPLNVVGELLVELGSIDALQEPLWQLIESPTVSDDAKDVANLVLRHLGDPSDPEAYLDYLEDPEGLITRETQRMLEISLQNPEALVDFIDFIFSLPDDEQLDLIGSLQQDYTPQQLANLLIPLLGAQPAVHTRLLALRILGESGQESARHFLQQYVRYWVAPADEKPTDEDERKIAQKALNRLTLQLKGQADTIPADAPLPPAEEPAMARITAAATLEWLRTTPVYRCFATIPDGVGNQGLMLSRRWPNGDLTLMCVVMNDHHGVMDCFGFYQISVEEFDRLVQKFYEENSRVVVPAGYIAGRLRQAQQLNWQSRSNIPYEFLCWQVLLSDIPSLDLHQQEELPALVDRSLAGLTGNLYQHPDFDTWFLEQDDWPQATRLFEDLYHKLANSRDPLVIISGLNQAALLLAQQIVDGEWGQLLSQRLWQCAYLLSCQQTPTFARLAATEATLLAEQSDLTDLGQLDGRFLLSYVRRCLREELLRIGLDKEKAMVHRAQQALSLILPLWGEGI